MEQRRANHRLQADGGTAAVWVSVVQAQVRGGFAPGAEPPSVRCLLHLIG
jgi:hypothetical protein